MAEIKTAVSNRLQLISQKGGHQAERLAIRDALVLLRILENENLKAS
jgi:hypothetical protein